MMNHSDPAFDAIAVSLSTGVAKALMRKQIFMLDSNEYTK